jgi:hypothetical protein
MDIKALVLIQPTDDGHGNDIDLPILIHFGPGITIEPHPRKAEDFSNIMIHGKTVRVRGNWKDIAKKAGYEIGYDGRGAIPQGAGSKPREIEAARARPLPTSNTKPLEP